jgi:hypothetical protein
VIASVAKDPGEDVGDCLRFVTFPATPDDERGFCHGAFLFANPRFHSEGHVSVIRRTMSTRLPGHHLDGRHKAVHLQA